jgi:hypothetical protein
MTYRLEVAFKENHTYKAREEQNNTIELAYLFGCESYYKDFEFSGEKREITRNTLFIIFNFPEDSKYIINFLKSVKKNKNICVESIGFDNIKFTLLYASKLYLNMMEHTKAIEYLNNKNFIADNSNYKNIIQAVK